MYSVTHYSFCCSSMHLLTLLSVCQSTCMKHFRTTIHISMTVNITHLHEELSSHVNFHLDHITLMATLCESLPMFLEYNWLYIYQSKENALKKSCEQSMNHIHHFHTFSSPFSIHLVAFEVTAQIKFCARTFNFLLSLVSQTCVQPGFSVQFDYSWLSSP
jgi:hypothetical protein